MRATNISETTSHQEDYLEALFRLTQQAPVARVKDVARELGVRMPSVSAALKSLERRGLLRHDAYGYIVLTEEGSSIGRRVHETHRLLFDFLVTVLDVPGEVAERDACRLEHDLSEHTRSQLVRFIDFLSRRSDILDAWHERKP